MEETFDSKMVYISLHIDFHTINKLNVSQLFITMC